MTELSKELLTKLIDDASQLNSPHIDLGPALGLPSPLLVKADGMYKLLEHESPTFSLSYDGAILTATPQEGGVMFGLDLQF